VSVTRPLSEISRSVGVFWPVLELFTTETKSASKTNRNYSGESRRVIFFDFASGLCGEKL